jgi:excisionase family DNA binding protein
VSTTTITLDPDQLGQLIADQLAELVGKPTPPLMTAEQAAEFLCVPVTWVRAEARAGRIPAVRLGRYTRFDPDELTAWRRARQVGPRRSS